MGGIVSYGAYVPYYRLDRSAIGATLGAGGGKGTRSVASFDEDPTSMGAEAGRAALAALPDGVDVERLYFATAAPPYLDKTNAGAIHAALDLAPSALAVDMAGAVRSGIGSMQAASEAPVPTLAVCADVRGGLPGGADERDGGDGAVAFVFGGAEPSAPVIAEIVAGASATAEFLDRWRLPGERSSRVWEERFGEYAYLPLVGDAFGRALGAAGLTAEQVDHLVVTGVHARSLRQVPKITGVRPDAIVDDLTASIGNTGTAHAGLVLADVLDRASPGETIALVVLADGVSVTVLRTTDAIASYTPASTVAGQVAAGNPGLAYASFLSWRGFLDREPPRRPDPTGPSAPAAYRSEHWKFGFTGSRCTDCGQRHMPPVRKCLSCGAIDHMEPERLADVPATIATFTVDRLAFTPSPPLVAAVIDFDGGGRFQCEITDVDPTAVRIGDRVEMTFRKIVTAGGIHNYFWKARPIRGA